MATPNLVNVSSVTPFTIAGAVTTSATDVIDVPADKAYKINTIIHYILVFIAVQDFVAFIS